MTYVLRASVFYRRRDDGRRVRYSRGDQITGLSDDDARRLLKAGAIDAVAPEPVINDVVAPEPEREPGDGKLPAAPTVMGKRPKRVAPKAEWVKYASTGAPPDMRLSRKEADSWTKAELIERLG